MVTSKQVTVQEIIADTCAILQKINSALNDHEQRLNMIEGSGLKIELDLLRRRIAMISDKEKHVEALRTVNSLCDALGIPNLELTPPYR